MAAFLLVSAALQHPWLLDADWGLRYSASAVFIFSPLLAAAAAYDVSRRVNPTLAELGRGSARGSLSTLLPVGAALIWALAATALSWALIDLLVAHAGGLGSRDWWVYLETIAAYSAAASVGALTGAYVRGITAVAVAAAVVLGAATLLNGWHIAAFEAASGTGTMIGIERTPVRAALLIAVNLSIALFCFAVTRLSSGAIRPSRVAMGALAAPLVVSAVVAVTLPIHDSEYRATREPQACYGSAPVLCGPSSAARLLRGAQHDLAAARVQLQGSGLALPDRFLVYRGDDVRTWASATQLDYDPSTLVAGHLALSSVVSAYATPRLCVALYGGPATEQYLARIDLVGRWLNTALRPADHPPGTAPAAVQAAYTALLNCPLPGEQAR